MRLRIGWQRHVLPGYSPQKCSAGQSPSHCGCDSPHEIVGVGGGGGVGRSVGVGGRVGRSVGVGGRVGLGDGVGGGRVVGVGGGFFVGIGGGFVGRLVGGDGGAGVNCPLPSSPQMNGAQTSLVELQR